MMSLNELMRGGFGRRQASTLFRALAGGGISSITVFERTDDGEGSWHPWEHESVTRTVLLGGSFAGQPYGDGGAVIFRESADPESIQYTSTFTAVLSTEVAASEDVDALESRLGFHRVRALGGTAGQTLYGNISLPTQHSVAALAVSAFVGGVEPTIEPGTGYQTLSVVSFGVELSAQGGS